MNEHNIRVQAIPVTSDKYARDEGDGMTLRDYFAASAMHGMVSVYGATMADALARDSYRIADAMLKARSA